MNHLRILNLYQLKFKPNLKPDPHTNLEDILANVSINEKYTNPDDFFGKYEIKKSKALTDLVNKEMAKQKAQKMNAYQK